jgi:hypothetical protein
MLYVVDKSIFTDDRQKIDETNILDMEQYIPERLPV